MASPSSGSRLRGPLLRGLAAPPLIRGAGCAFVAALIVQGTLIVDRMVTTSHEQDVTSYEAIDPLMAEPAAGPEPSQAPAGPEPGVTAPEEPGGQPAACEPHLLRALEERSRELDAWSSELADRARMLEVIETRAAEQVRALKAQREALQAVLASVEEGTEAEIARLVKIYENMKPKEAARIFEAMPADVAAGFIRRMDESKSALVMGRVAAEHAYAITLAIANHPAPPDAPESGG